MRLGWLAQAAFEFLGYCYAAAHAIQRGAPKDCVRTRAVPYGTRFLPSTPTQDWAKLFRPSAAGFLKESEGYFLVALPSITVLHLVPSCDISYVKV